MADKSIPSVPKLEDLVIHRLAQWVLFAPASVKKRYPAGYFSQFPPNVLQRLLGHILHFVGPGIDWSNLRLFFGSESIHTLWLHGNPHANDSLLQQVQKTTFPALRTLCLSSCPITAVVFSSMLTLSPTLQRLNLSGCRELDQQETLRSLCKLRNLTHLSLMGCHLRIDGNVFQYLANLQDLDVSENYLSVDVLRDMSKLTRLSRLILHGW